MSLAQVAIAWLLARPAVSSVILGARSTGQLAGNMAAAELKLTPEETQLLDEASEPPSAAKTDAGLAVWQHAGSSVLMLNRRERVPRGGRAAPGRLGRECNLKAW